MLDAKFIILFCEDDLKDGLIKPHVAANCDSVLLRHFTKILLA